MINLTKDTKAISEHSLKNQYIHIVDKTNIVSKTNPQGIITYVNSKFVEISGYSKEELIGQPHNIVRDPQNDKSLFEELWSTIKSKNVWNGIITNLHKNGTRYTVKASIFPIVDDYGDIVEYIAIRHDITELQELNAEVKRLHDYDVSQQKIAREKFELGIVNHFSDEECKVLYKPSDILSGDFYSIYKREDGSIFLYVIDGQGHGISPAMTVFAISSIINNTIHDIKNLNELTEQLHPLVKNFLGEIEQLSYTMMIISPDRKMLSYTSGGMYPFYIKDTKGEVLKIKANNLPFMNFSQTPLITDMKIDGLKSLIIYTDGIMEHEYSQLESLTPKDLIQEPKLINKTIDTVNTLDFDDDITLLYLEDI